MIEVTASGRFPEAELTAGVFLSGGSHKCYLNNPRSNASSGRHSWEPPAPPDFKNVAFGSCANCNSSQACGERQETGYGENRTQEPYNTSSAAKMRKCSVSNSKQQTSSNSNLSCHGNGRKSERERIPSSVACVCHHRTRRRMTSTQRRTRSHLAVSTAVRRISQVRSRTLIRAILSYGAMHASGLKMFLVCVLDYMCTEQYFLDHPEAYKTHPPTFLAQMRTLDINADLCASRNYHETMLAHGATSHIALVPAADERCFCVGTPGLEGLAGAAAAGNPFAKEGCPIVPPDTHPSQRYEDGEFHCMDHTMGFAAMVEQLTQFLMDALANQTHQRRREGDSASGVEY
eukprot:SAG22_NODE_705_length_7772_cov_45.048742_6_plen_346_part_00